MNIRREAFYLDTPRGALFALHTRPAEGLAADGGVLFLPPFAEEMNKSRRMVALASRAFAASGWSVLQFDLNGTGDSAGEFADFSWSDWLDDASCALDYLQSRLQNTGPIVLWSLRAGSLLAADLLKKRQDMPAQRSRIAPHMLAWQPVFNGRQHLTQFLRLKAANDMLADAKTGTGVGADAAAALKTARSALQNGESVEVAGYTLSAALAQGLEASTFDLPANYAGQVHCCELASAEGSALSPVLAQQIGRLREQGVRAEATVVPGPAFWHTQEIEEVPELIETSLAVLQSWKMGPVS